MDYLQGVKQLDQAYQRVGTYNLGQIIGKGTAAALPIIEPCMANVQGLLTRGRE